MLRSPDFVWTAERADDWRKPWPDFSGTRYEAKAKREGRVPAYFIFRRTSDLFAPCALPHLPEAHHALRGGRGQPLEISSAASSAWLDGLGAGPRS